MMSERFHTTTSFTLIFSFVVVAVVDVGFARRGEAFDLAIVSDVHLVSRRLHLP